jgi:hypothetical protein
MLKFERKEFLQKMTQQEIIEQIKHFPISERVKIIEQISQSLLTDLESEENGSAELNDEKKELTTDDKIAIVENLYGSLHAEGKFIPMTKEEVREMRLEYLMEKYS